MKLILTLLLVLSLPVWAEQECKVTTVTIDRDGQLQSDSVTVCKNGDGIDTKIKISDIILESEVDTNPKVNQYFTYRNTRCRLFQERAVKDKKLRVYNGVICQIDRDATNWLVVDKW